MDNPTRTITVDTKTLHPALRALVKRTGFRPSTVEITLSVMPAEIVTYYRTGEVFPMGEEWAVIDTSYMGSDGEWNYSKRHVHSAPVAVTVPKCGARTSNAVRISVGGLYPFRSEIEDIDHGEGSKKIDRNRLEAMIEFALSEQI